MSDASAIAHVEGTSGTFIVPVHTPYDRQLLREHLRLRLGRAATLTLGARGTRWTVTRSIPSDARCGTCTRFVGRVSCSSGDAAGATCIDCAMQPIKKEERSHE